MDDTDKRIINVRITNNNTEDFTDSYNGKDFVFKSGKTTSIPLEAAHHLFGYSVKGCDERVMFHHVCKRWGWNTPENVKSNFDSVKKIWSNFEFTPVAVRMTEVPVIDTASLADAKESVPQPQVTPGVEVPNLKLGEPSIRGAKSAAA